MSTRKQRKPQEMYEHLKNVVSSKTFLAKEGLGNEVPFFICDFAPEDTVEMYRTINQLASRLQQEGVQVLQLNLYDLSIEILRERGVFDRICEMEQGVEKTQLKELLQGVLDSENHLVPAIAKKMDETLFDVLFITGIGEVFPYIRSHNVLNNLQSTAKEKPTLMFFPGQYTHSLEDGASLDLFSLLHDDKYYRAFNIFDREA